MAFVTVHDVIATEEGMLVDEKDKGKGEAKR